MTQHANIDAADDSVAQRAMPAKKRVTKKKVAAGSRKVASKKATAKKVASKKTTSKKTISKKTISKKVASKKAASKKVASKKKVVRNKRVAQQPVPASPAAEALADKLAKVEAAAASAKQRVDELRTKVREARARFKAKGDKRAKRTIESSVEKLTALNARVVDTAAAVSKARAELREQMRQDAQAIARDSALAAAIEKFTAKWLKDYDRRMRVRTRASKMKKR